MIQKQFFHTLRKHRKTFAGAKVQQKNDMCKEMPIFLSIKYPKSFLFNFWGSLQPRGTEQRNSAGLKTREQDEEKTALRLKRAGEGLALHMGAYSRARVWLKMVRKGIYMRFKRMAVFYRGTVEF